MTLRLCIQVLLATIGLALVSAGCGLFFPQPVLVVSDVSRFHTLSEEMKGKTVFVQAARKENATSLEFKSYTDKIVAKLKAYGFSSASAAERADYLVFLDYSVSSGQQVVQSVPAYGQTSQETTSQVYGSPGPPIGTIVTPPTYGRVGSDIVTSVVYTRQLSMEVIDRPAFKAGKLEKVFEGKVVSTGSSPQFPAVAGCLIDALFNKFPGESGQTQRVNLPLQSCGK